jgi:ABC-type antimicrobial peptide transport system ATPase subunit
MRQRVMIAMAMALDPALLIADEPTTALDVTVQAQVLSVMTDLQERFGTALVLITHDLGVVAQLADEVVVMYAGTAMERGPRRTIFYSLPPPTPDWGGMISTAQNYYTVAWWFVLFPGLALLITTLAFNLFGDGVRDAVDPRTDRLLRQ